jgi:hypothetical protein
LKLLLFQAQRFAFSPFAATVAGADPAAGPGEVRDAVVAWVQVEPADLPRIAQVEKKAAKYIKWLAGKRGLKQVVLHSFAHLGGESAPADRAGELLGSLGARLESVGYGVTQTPFGYTCHWELEVYGDSLAKVFQEV